MKNYVWIMCVHSLLGKKVVSVSLEQTDNISFEQNITKMAYNYSNSIHLILWFGYVNESKQIQRSRG